MRGMAGPAPASVERVHPHVRRLLAPNPSPFTYTGTQTYMSAQARSR